MRKAGVLIVILLTVLVFSTKAFASLVMTLSDGRDGYDQPPFSVGLDISNSEHYCLTEGVLVEHAFGGFSHAFTFHATNDVLGLEIYSVDPEYQLIYFNIGWEPYSTREPDFGIATDYMVFSDGVIEEDTYFGILTPGVSTDMSNVYIHPIVPIPSTFILLGFGLLGLIRFRKQF